MKLINATKMVAGYTLGLDKHGKESLVVVIKGTFQIPGNPSREPELTTEQLPLITADVHTGEPGFSAVQYETDYAPFKRKCDVLLNGSAYAPWNKPTQRVTVSIRIGSMNKSFDVVGKRSWVNTMLGMGASPIEPFSVMPFNYDVAYGGIDKTIADQAKQKSYLPNHVGKGYHDNINALAVVGQPLPNTEETGKPISSPRGTYRPMAFGPILRVHPERVKHAGTYDQNWLDNVSPFLPSDFQDEYFQAAPSDQQIDYPSGGEDIELTNLTPAGFTRFQLPRLSVPVEFTMRANASIVEKIPVIDTVQIEPDANRFSVAWRTQLPLRKNIFEVTSIIVGKMPSAWYRARLLGKNYYPSLQEMVKAAKGRR